jgi:hypothetical protein
MTRITLFLCLFALPLAAQTAGEPRLELQSLSLGVRYRMLENHLGSRVQNWSEHHQGLKLRFRIDDASRYSVSAVAGNGDSFLASWNPRGVKGRSSNRVFVKQLFVTAKPREGVELQYGALPIARGESSEITSYDNDGYLTGQRLTLSNVTITAAYLGDFNAPSVTRRWRRLDEVNYGQLLLKRKLSDRLTASADFTHADGERTFRQGLAMRPASVVDLIRLEAYQRTNGAGGALTVEKTFGRARLAATFASIDDEHRPLNSDRYGRGKRLSLTGTMPITRDVSLQVFVTRALENDVAMPNRTRVDVHLRYELAR